MLARLLAAIAAMVVVVAASNILVLYPLQAQLGSVNLADLLTWGAFTFPFAFLVTDLTNRYDGPRKARLVVLAGFLVGLGLSFYLSYNPLPWNVGGDPATTQRIALASATAFLVGQLLDIAVFSRLRASKAWFLPPLAGSLFGSADRYDDLLHSRLRARRWPASTRCSAWATIRWASRRHGSVSVRTCRCGSRWPRATSW